MLIVSTLRRLALASLTALLSMRTTDRIVTPNGNPRLITIVDTEEEFDWSKPFSREATPVQHMRRIGRLQRVFDSHGVCPAYVVDYPIASQPEAWQPLREFQQSGRASIGAHLHPWVNPPYEEELSPWNSYHGNLSRIIESRKLAVLTASIEQAFDFSPAIFKAGRYGIGSNTLAILSELGYQIDFSPAPTFDCSSDGGPDFSHMSCEPFQDPETGLIIAPGSAAFSGWWPAHRATVHRWATSGWRARLHANALWNRSGAIRRRWLSPEGFQLSELISLTKFLLNRGTRLFVISLHSPVVMPGATPYARTEEEVQVVLDRLGGYFRFFFTDLAGEPWTPEGVLEHWLTQPSCTSLVRAD